MFDCLSKKKVINRFVALDEVPKLKKEVIKGTLTKIDQEKMNPRI